MQISEIIAYALLAAFIVTQVLDLVSTYLVINIGGGEKTPMIKWLGNIIGLKAALVVFKLFTSGLLTASVWLSVYAAHLYNVWFMPLIMAASLAYLIVVYVGVLRQNWATLQVQRSINAAKAS